MTGNRFKLFADTVIFYVVIPADYPNFALEFNPDLRRSDNVTCRMQGNPDAVQINWLIPVCSLNLLFTQPKFEQIFCKPVAEIKVMSGAGVIAVCMGNDCPVHGFPGVNVEITGGAVNPAICKTEKAHF